VRYHGAWQLARPIDQLNVPASVEGLVMANLDTLPAAAKTVLQYASVIGQRFNLELLSAMAPTANLDDLLIDLQQRGLIKEITALGEPDRIFTFAQVIVREVTYNSILRKTRRQLHEQIASLTEARQITQQPENVEALAYHYAAGGNQEKLMVYNWLAGQQALERFEFKEAENHLNTAWNSLRELPSPDPKILKGVAEALGDVSTFTGNYAQAAVCYQIVQSLAVAPDDQIWLHYRLGRLNFYQANPTEASQHYQQALELAQANPALQAQIDAEIRLLYDLG
jgi:predicted ATPase